MLAQRARADVVIDSTHFTVGATAGGNTVNSNWVGPAFSITAPIIVGSAAGGATGFGDNTVTTSNFFVTATAASYIGNGSSSNLVSLLADTTWNLANNMLNIGMGAATGNVVTLNGGVISNAGGLRISGTITSGYNSLIVTNGGRFVMTTAAPITIGGGNTGGAIGGGNNTVILSNSVLLGFNPNGWSIIGFGSSNNTVSLLANTTWDNSNQELDFGWGAAANNQLNVNGATLTNFTGLYIGAIGGGAFSNSVSIRNGGKFFNNSALVIGGGASANDNSLIVTNGGRYIQTGGAVTIGAPSTYSGGTVGGNNNTVILSNSLVTLTGAFTFGQNGSSNTLTLLPDTVWNNNGGATLGMAVGRNSATANVLTVSGAIVSNVGPLTVGANAGAIGNQVIVNNGGTVSNVTALIVGAVPGADHNRLIVTNGGLFMTSAGSIGVGASAAAGNAGGSYNTVLLSNSVLLAGGAASWSIMGFNSSNNTLTLLQNSTWNNGGLDLYVGWVTTGAIASSNILTVTGATITNVLQLLLGRNSQAVSNRVVINDGGKLFVGNNGVTIGNSAGGNHNSLIISNGGLLDVNSLVLSGGTGNTVSNSGGIYQFSLATPTITSITRGDIAITNGTIAFRGISTADVTNNLGNGALRNIVFAGANTFMLNAASNTIAGQTYTFDAMPGNPSNYVNLTLVNGATAYRGGNLTIGQTGSLLISNTTASVTGLFTNQGQTKLVNATAGFANGVINSGGLSLHNATLTGTVTNLAAGTLQGNGLIVGDVTSFGTNSPGFSVGTLSITGSLTLASTAVTVMELFGNGSNDLLTVSGVFTYGGTLTVTNATGFTFADGQSFQLFEFGSRLESFGTTNLPALPGTLGWNTSQLDAQGLLSIVVVPEPSTVLLVVIGGLTLLALRRTRHHIALLVLGGFSISVSLVNADITTFVTTNLSTFNVGTVSGQSGQLLNATNAVSYTQMTSGQLLIGGQFNTTTAGSSNSVIISNATLTTSSSYSIIGGWNATNNSLTLLSNTLWTAGAGVIVGYSAGGANGASSSNLLTINGGRLNVTGNELDIGWGSLSSGNGVILTNGGRLTTPNLYLSAGANANNNYLIVTGAGSLLTNNGIFYLAGATAGGVSNSVTIADGGRMYNGNVLYVGYVGGGYNTVTVTDTGSVLRLNSALYVGPFGAGNNQVIVSNGGSLINNVGTIGGISSSRSNSVLVTGPGSIWSNAGALAVGGYPGANFNSVTISNGGRLSTTGIATIGYGSNSNRVTVAGNGAVWDAGGFAIVVGNFNSLATGSSNSLVIGSGGTVTNVAGLNVGVVVNANFNSLIATNGGAYLMKAGGQVQVGANAPGGAQGGNHNTVIFSNNVLTSGGNYSTIGGQSYGNTMTLLAGTVWNDSFGINIGRQTGASNNLLIVNGGKFDGTGGFDFDIGWGNGANNNGLIVTNGGTVITPAAFGLFVGAPTAGGQQADNNYVVVTGAGSSLTNNGILYLAGATFGGSNNMVTVANGGRWVNVGTFYNGYTGSGYELVTVTGTGSVLQINSPSALILGNAGVGNNRLIVNHGGLLEANILTIGATTGNSISNIGGIYQFTAAPTLTPNGQVIALTDGTISFRATTAADVSAISGMRFAGTNTFRLNAATNTTSGQTYTFGIVPGNPTNYANLVMVNGTTAYRGGNLTIGQTGSLLISNTTASITGVFTNTGSLSVVNAYATFQSRVYNSGTNQMLNSVVTFNAVVVNSGAWITDPTTNIFNGDHIVTSDGFISAAAGDIYRFRSNFVNQSTQTTTYNTRNTTPGNSGEPGTKFIFDGTNTVSSTGYTQNFFTAGLRLTGGFVGTPTPLATGVQTVSTFAAVSGFIDNFALDRLELGNTGTNSLLLLSSTFGLSDSGNTNALFVNDLWIFGDSRLIISNNTMVYFVNSNNWSTANYQLLGNAQLHQLVLGDNVIVAVVPEPTVVLLWLAGIGTIYASRRRQSKRWPYKARL